MTDTALSDGTGGAVPRSFAALRHPGCRPYLIGAALAMMADSIEHVISYWMIFEKFQSPTLGGFAVISHWLPFLLFSFYSGALADRFDPRRLIQLGMLLFMAASLAWGILFFFDTLELWHAVAILTVHGLAGVLWAPAAQLLVHHIVGGSDLQSAVRMIATSRVLGLLLGPAIGGGMMLAFGPATAILLNVLIYLPLTLWLWRAPYGPRFRREAAGPPRAIRGFADVVSTIRAVAGDPTVVSMILLAGSASLIVGNAHQAQMPEFASDLGYGEAGVRYSMLLAANAAGALTAGLVLETRGLLPARPRIACLLVVLWCLTMAGFSAATAFPLAVALLFVAGFLDLSYNSMAQTLVQLHAPDEIRGRVIGLYNTSHNGLRAFSGVTVGIGGGIIGIHWSLALSAGVLLVVSLGLLSMTLRAAAAGPAGD
jgi:MFS family permease